MIHYSRQLIILAQARNEKGRFMRTTMTLLASHRIAARTYRESGFQPIPKVYLEDEEYGRGLQRFIGVCTDIAIINNTQRKIYLAQRQAKPMQGWWWLGGGQLPNETHIEAAIRNFKRETQIELSPKQLVYRAKLDYLWKDRQQSPQDTGCHMEAHTFTVDLPIEEIEKIQLEPTEFVAEAGLTAFDREKLLEEEVVPPILDLYDDVFPIGKSTEASAMFV